jgi:hypothetical protein
LRRRYDRAARERRGLAIDRPPRRVEFLFQLFVVATQPLPLRFRPPEVFAQALDLARLILDDLLRVARGVLRPLGHAPVKPNSRKKYKSKVCLQRLTR